MHVLSMYVHYGTAIVVCFVAQELDFMCAPLYLTLGVALVGAKRYLGR